MKKIFLSLIAYLLLGFPISVQLSFAEVILPPGHTWEYTFTDPTGNPSWNTTTGVGGIWSLGPAPFGSVQNNPAYDPDFDYNTYWASDGSDGDDLWVRTTIDLANYNLSTVTWDLGVDNGFKLYANGFLVDAHNAEEYTYRWEYTGDFSNISLLQGNNVIAVALEDHGIVTAFDMQITGTVVPEPISSILFATGGVLLAGRRYLRRKA